MTTPNNDPKTKKDEHLGKRGESAGRERGYESEGGAPGNDSLEDGQRRGIDEDGNIERGTHSGRSGPKDKGGRRGAG